MIVLDEIGWAKEAIRAKDLGKRPYESLCRVAKYYIHTIGYTVSDARKEVEKYLTSCDSTISLVKWSNLLDKVMSAASKKPPVKIDEIKIYKSEMDAVDALNGKQVRRLAFTLLCLSKYWDCVNDNKDHWVNTPDSEIMRVANINTSIKRQSAMYWQLKEAGLIRFSKKVDNTNVCVLFQDESDDREQVLSIIDFRNLGYQYLYYHGEPYFVCENCGITTKIRNPSVGRRQKYCKSCAEEIQIQQIIAHVMNARRLKNHKISESV